MGDRWRAVAALVDSSRRALYDYVRRQDHPVSREEAADAGRLSRGLAAFHLDKLVDVGLLRARYQSPPGRIRGRGRSPKVYEPAGDELAITVPERRYDLIAEILVDAVADDPRRADEAALRHARDRGQVHGASVRGGIEDALTDLGFEPEPDGDGRLLMRNCPFHALAARQTALVCGLNHAFVNGLVEGMGLGDVRARLVPRPHHCCVELAPA